MNNLELRSQAKRAVRSVHISGWPVILTLAVLLFGRDDARGQEKYPVYVGAKACAACHHGPDMGYQHSRWLLSAHARAYASLATPEAKRIAALSGEPQDPLEAALCLGCHATAADTEAWERDPSFHLADGIQCEKCHGPGSEYMDEQTMTDPEAAMRAGLIMPSRAACMKCHREKGSHVAVHGRGPVDIDKHWRTIAHPTPDDPSYLPLEEESGKGTPLADGARLIGASACAECHCGPDSGQPFSRWRSSAHARAYADLATPKGREIASLMGVDVDPTESTECRECHVTPGIAAADELSYAMFEGIGCEACHGPGGRHASIAATGEQGALLKQTLSDSAREDCGGCHRGYHGESFDLDAALKKIAHPRVPAEQVEAVRYKTPMHMAFRPGSEQLWLTCEASDSVIVIDTLKSSILAEIAVGRHPNDVTFHPDGSRAYVSNRLDDSVSVIDTGGLRVESVLSVGDAPHGVLTNKSGSRLYVLNTLADNISVIDTRTLREIKRLATSRNPWSLALAPDGNRLLVTNTLSRFVKFRQTSLSEVTVIDTADDVVSDRLVLSGANLLQGIAWHPSGRFALTTLNRSKNLVPMTRLLQGWTITNGLGIVWADGRVDQVLLDEPTQCFPDPTDVAITPDGRLALVTSSGLDRVAVVDLKRLVAMLEGASAEQRARVFPNHLGKPTEFVLKHIRVRNTPRGIAVSADGKRAFTANALDDSVSVIDLETLEESRRIDLGGPKEITRRRLGESIFHDTNITFQNQFSCHTCHPDGHVNGLTFDIEPDGIGAGPVDNRTLRGILDMAPFKWEGTNPSLQRQCGPRLAVFFTRLRPYTPAELAALDEYICTIPRPPNRYRPLGAELTDAQRRGKAMFERTRTNDGRVIPSLGRCVTCHFPPLYTDGLVHNVGTRMWLDETGDFDVPHLSNIYNSAPYLHNGIAETLEEIWTRYNPNDEHGVTNDMTKDQLNDLIEYLKTL
jgi:YVTN family beta-propeller protein